MKKISTLLLSFLILSLVQGQYASYNFDDGLQGWIASGTGVDFAFTKVGPEPSTSTWSVPVLNSSTPTGWIILDDDASGKGLITESYFTSPVINLTSAPAQLKFEFEQYFQEYEVVDNISQGNDTTTIEVSTDGFLTYVSLPINDGVGRTNRPNPELKYVDITSALDGGDLSNVQFRFRYRANWSYGWQFDNVKITELVDHDLFLSNAFKENLEFFWEFRQLPLSQVQAMAVGVELWNLGADTLNNITAKVNIVNPSYTNEALLQDSATILSLLPFTSDTIWIETGFTPTEIGEYVYNFSISADEKDLAVGNETLSKTLETTEQIYSHTVESELDYSATGKFEGDNVEFFMANLFPIAEETNLLAVQFKVGEGTDVGSEVSVTIDEYLGYSQVNGIGIDEIEVESFTQTITQANLDGEWVNLWLDDELTLDAGSIYAIGVQARNKLGEHVFIASSFGDSDFSTLMQHELNDGVDYYFGAAFTPSIRLKIGEWNVSIEEKEGKTFSLGQNIPNPFSQVTSVEYTVERPSVVTVTIADITGKVISEAVLGNIATGSHKYQIDASALSAGIYFYKLKVGNVEQTRKMIVE